MAEPVLKVLYLRELVQSLNAVAAEIPASLESSISEGAEIIAADARARFEKVSADSASTMLVHKRPGLKTTVEQEHRRVTGLRPDYGALQMRTAFLPAKEANQDKAVSLMQAGLDALAAEHGF